MGYIEAEEQFPCGYKVQFKAGGVLRPPNYDFETQDQCPLHGENCSPQKQGEEE